MAIRTLIEKFSVNALKDFFRERINTFKLDEENYEYLFDENDYINENYKNIVKIGEANLTNTDDILVFTAKTLTQLTNRTGKKRQFEIAKKILKQENKDAAFFIFYDDNGNFRFSLIRVNFLGAKRDFTDFKRYTYFVSPEQTNKTFINQISKCDLNSLDSIQEAFSVEPITKQFYEKLQRWYFWAIENVKFPKDAEQETNGREIAIIRLITRLMFIWFMKVRNLIPAELFYEENIRKILKDFSGEESTYYKAILQNLFFATLNTKQDERKFRSEIRGAKGYNSDYGNHNLFRYHNLFSNEESLNDLFSKIPFLNGGLFECLDYKTKDKNERKYIDGFTATKENQPIVPNFLFFSEIQKVDISSFFGKANKTYEVEGLINLLNSYNFTIDENEPDDIEVALDPELLGSIFENLLASYNPETATTARKATGSFYTPREIVNYMTTESLKQYFRQSSGSILLSNISSQHEVLDTISSKQDAFGTFLNPNDEIIIKQGKLPHWTQDNSWYFVTFRLADSLPKEKVEQLKNDREIWFINHKKKERNEYTKEELKEYYYLFSERVEKWLNAGYGKCVLGVKENAEIVANALKHFESKMYELDEWVVMPNHVHVLVKPFDNYQLSDINHSWKSFTANEINKNINSSGQLWMHESYDHIVRNEKAFKAIKNYIRQNPEKAGIVSKASSFQFQKEQGQKQTLKQTSKQDALDTLFDTDSENPFDEETTKKLIKLINDLRVVDPAVGSGAFPMAMLNKLVFILSKLDPDNRHWKQSQIDGVKKAVSDSVIQRKLIEQIERQFKEKNADYGRKLYLIEKCIYGVDIQQIAVEIAKLRFFISLLVDEKIDLDKPENNYGIEPLPNLEFKLMQGNSLISTYAGIDFNDKDLPAQAGKPTENLLFDDTDEPYKKLIKEFEELKNEYQNEADNETKKELRNKIDKSVIKIFEEKISKHFPQLKRIEENAKQFPKEEQRKKYITEEKQKLTKKLGFDIEQVEKDLIAYTEGRKAKDFFLWNVYFAEVFTEKARPERSRRGGFDVVIGNPPYVFTRDVDFGLDFKKYVSDNYFANIALPKKSKARQAGKINLFALFILKGKNLVNVNGSLVYIVPNNILRATVYDIIRYELLKRNDILSIVDLGTGIFSKVTASTILLQIANKTTIKNFKSKVITDVKSLKNRQFKINLVEQSTFLKNTSYTYNIMLSDVELKLSNKIKKNKKMFGEFCVDIIEGIVAHKHLIIEKSENNTFELIEGKDIKRFVINTASNFIIWDKDKIHRTRPDYLWNEKKKIVMQRISGGSMPLVAALDIKKRKTFASTNNIVFKKEYNEYYEFFTCLLNSKLMNWFYANNFSNNSNLTVNISKTFLETLPIPKISNSQQKSLETLVNKIISKKELGEDTTAEERKIDLMVYKLYELTYDEVKIVEPAFALTEKEYINYEW